jgi:hypothetical protein
MGETHVDSFWIALVLIAQFAWAFENYIDKYLVEHFKLEDSEESAVGKLVLFSCFFCAVAALVIYLTSVIFFSADELRLSGLNTFVALGVGVLEMVWLIPYLYALSRSDEIVAPPLFQTVPVFGFLLGFFIFSEVPAGLHIIAGSIILLGSVILNLELAQEKQGGNQETRIDWLTIGYMLVASLIVAIAAFLFKITALDENYIGTAFWMSVGGALTGLALWTFVPKYRREFNAFIVGSDTRVKIVNVINEVVDTVAVLAFYGAIVLGPATAVVQSTIAYQPIILLGIAAVAARYGSERHKKISRFSLARRTIGIAIVVIGSLLVLS